MIKFLSSIFTIFLLLAVTGCQSTTETKTENTNNSVLRPTPPPVAEKTVQTNVIDVPKLADKSIAEIDKVFGPPDGAKSIENGGQYRLYKIANQPKGLAVRFYGGKAKNFNIILDKPVSTSKEALKVFSIDVGNAAPVKDPKEPLSEKYQGTYGGVRFTKVSAKRQESGQGFIFILAEVAE